MVTDTRKAHDSGEVRMLQVRVLPDLDACGADMVER